jgi:hypothetical protein
MLETERFAVFQTASEGIAAVACHEVRPDLKREGVQRGLADRERAITAGPRVTLVRRKLQGSSGKATRARRNLRRAGGAGYGRRRLVRERTGDKCTSADAGFEITLREELGIGRENGDARDGEFSGESASGGDLLSRGEIAANDGGAEGVVDLAMNRMRGPAIDNDEWGKRGRSLVHARDYSGHIELGSSGY